MEEPQNNPPSGEKDLYFLNYLIVLVKYSRLILCTTILVMVLTYFILLILPNKYTAIARLLSPQQNLTMSAQLLNTLGGGGVPGAPMTAGGAGGLAANLLGLKYPADIYAGMMIGNTIFDRIIERFNLRSLYREKYIESARIALSKRAKISVNRKDGLISVEVTDKDPKQAAEIANAFAEELDKLLRDLSAQEAHDRQAFLEKERVETNQNLIKAENLLRVFSEQNSVIQIDTQTRGVVEYIGRLRAEIDAKEIQIQVMRKQATSYNYDMVRLETEVQGLKTKLKAAETQYDQACIGDVCLTSSKVPSLGMEYLRLYREVKFQDGLYQLYTKMVELARLDMAKDYPVIKVVDRARPPERRSNKRLLPTVFAGLITSFIMILFAFGRESWNDLTPKLENSPRWAMLRSYFAPWRKVG